MAYEYIDEKEGVKLVKHDGRLRFKVGGRHISSERDAPWYVEVLPHITGKVYMVGLGFGSVCQYASTTQSITSVHVYEIEDGLVDLFDEHCEVCSKTTVYKGDGLDPSNISNSDYDTIFIDIDATRDEAMRDKLMAMITARPPQSKVIFIYGRGYRHLDLSSLNVTIIEKETGKKPLPLFAIVE